MDRFVYKSGEKLRCGYTTGSCAAAASLAAAEALLTGAPPERVELPTPKGITLDIPVAGCKISGNSALCSVIKDSGDDPDITNGIEVCARVELTEDGISIDGGEGIGRVTKPGLDQPPGAAAINSVPRKMIAAAVSDIAETCDYHGGFRIVVSVPNGAELASRTYNPRMGIEGGISIIGTTGIVEPMSNSALVDTIRLEERMRREEGCRSLLLTLGNYSQSFIQRNMPFALDRCVTCSNFIGEAIEAALEY
ncbi:MAG: cobalt-precorrin-5B (C(1))-methyltransferase CbiD, partial [Eggerthellaceae bacterium]